MGTGKLLCCLRGSLGFFLALVTISNIFSKVSLEMLKGRRLGSQSAQTSDISPENKCAGLVAGKGHPAR